MSVRKDTTEQRKRTNALERNRRAARGRPERVKPGVSYAISRVLTDPRTGKMVLAHFDAAPNLAAAKRTAADLDFAWAITKMEVVLFGGNGDP
jgi:hypothetical protein